MSVACSSSPAIWKTVRLDGGTSAVHCRALLFDSTSGLQKIGIYPLAAATSAVTATTKAGSWTTDGVARTVGVVFVETTDVEVGQFGRRPTPQIADEMTEGSPPAPLVALVAIGELVVVANPVGLGLLGGLWLSDEPVDVDNPAAVVEVGQFRPVRKPSEQSADATPPPIPPTALVTIGMTAAVAVVGSPGGFALLTEFWLLVELDGTPEAVGNSGVVVETGQTRPVRRPIEQSAPPIPPPAALVEIGTLVVVGMIGVAVEVGQIRFVKIPTPQRADATPEGTPAMPLTILATGTEMVIPIWRSAINAPVVSGRERLNEGGFTLACGWRYSPTPLADRCPLLSMLKTSPCPVKPAEPKPMTVLARAESASANVPSASVPDPEATTPKLWIGSADVVVDTCVDEGFVLVDEEVEPVAAVDNEVIEGEEADCADELEEVL